MANIPVLRTRRQGGAGGAAPPSYDAASEAFFAAATTPLTTAAKAAVDALVVGLKADAIWDSLDVLWPMAMETEQAGRLNLKSPGTFTLTAVNTPTFTAKFGWAGNGSSSHLNTGWDASTNGVQFVQNSASFGCWVDAGTDTASTSAFILGAYNASSAGNSLIPWASGSVSNGSVNAGSSFAPTLPANTRFGFTAYERTGASANEAYKNGASMGTATTASVARHNVDWFIGALNNNGSRFGNADNRISCAFMGASLGTTKQAALYTRLNTFRTAMAAIT